MKIRSITYFCNPKYPLDAKILRIAGEFLTKAKSAYQAAGYEVQSTRLATIPFPRLLGEKQIEELPGLAEQLEKSISEIDIGYGSLGPALPDLPRSYEVIPEALSASQNIFFAGAIADNARGIDLGALRACSQVIVKSASIEANGFANLRLAALANVPAGAPFFPAAYWDRDEPAFAIATEAADLAVEAFSPAKTLDIGRSALVADIEKHGKAITSVARKLTRSTNNKSSKTVFHGIDFSLAPFPAEAQSLGVAFERLGVPKVGWHGSLAAAAILTESIERAKFPRAGFSGLMLPVLEDAVLAQRAAEGTLTIKDLLVYSAVCGTGLDTVPLPGDTTADQITALLVDLSALALRLGKPLTARLLPIPGKKAGESTTFDFGFFANSRVMSLDSGELRHALSHNDIFALRRH
jgi:uncharacterized protein (UPF0210 family)